MGLSSHCGSQHFQKITVDNSDSESLIILSTKKKGAAFWITTETVKWTGTSDIARFTDIKCKERTESLGNVQAITKILHDQTTVWCYFTKVLCSSEKTQR